MTLQGGGASLSKLYTGLHGNIFNVTMNGFYLQHAGTVCQASMNEWNNTHTVYVHQSQQKQNKNHMTHVRPHTHTHDKGNEEIDKCEERGTQAGCIMSGKGMDTAVCSSVLVHSHLCSLVRTPPTIALILASTKNWLILKISLATSMLITVTSVRPVSSQQWQQQQIPIQGYSIQGRELCHTYSYTRMYLLHIHTY